MKRHLIACMLLSTSIASQAAETKSVTTNTYNRSPHTLILTLYGTGQSSIPTISSVPGFLDKESCLKAARAWKSAVEKEFNQGSYAPSRSNALCASMGGESQ